MKLVGQQCRDCIQVRERDILECGVATAHRDHASGTDTRNESGDAAVCTCAVAVNELDVHPRAQFITGTGCNTVGHVHD